jgi:D-arabinitol 4-dehydrogenase
LTAPEISADLAAARTGGAGTTIYGALAAIFRERMRNGAGGVTLLNCDNLRHNGARARAGLVQFVTALGDDAMLQWLQTNTSSPSAMVDRITPRPSPEVAIRVRAATGRTDMAALMAESFIQWVIEEDFIAGRPPWETVDVEMVESVAPYEEAKIRLLNATHGCVAWAGALAGHLHVHDSVRDPWIRGVAHDYVTDDAIPALSPSPVDLPAYRDLVLERFGNAGVPDTNQRITSDSFAKLSGFVAPTVRDRLSGDESIEAVAMLPALFLAFLQRWHQGALPFAYQEQVADLALARAICADADPVAALAAQARVWGSLAGDERLRAAIRRAAARVAAFEAGPRPDQEIT